MALTAFLPRRVAWANSFQYRDFRLLWGATLFHSVGMGMEQVALGYLILDMTDSPFMVGVSAAARMAPFFFLGIISGAVADRVDRRILLRFITLGGTITSTVMALVLISGSAQVWQVIALAGATGSLWAFVMTLRQAYIFDIVGPELALNGLSLSSMSQRFGGVIGSIISGIIIATLGVGTQYLLVGAMYVIAAGVLFGTRDVGQLAPRGTESVLRNVIGYFQLLRENHTLAALMFLTASTEVFGFTHQTLLPVFARDVVGVGAVGLGIMIAVRQGGGLIGLLLLANLGNFQRKGYAMFFSAIAFGAGLMTMFVTRNIYLFLLVLTLVNASASAADTLYKTLMQSNVPNEQRGRAMGSWVLSIGMAPIGHLGVGGMAGALGAPGALLINGSILTAVSVSALLGLPRIRRLN